MLNIEQIAIDAVKKTLSSDALKETIEAKVSSTVTTILNDHFREFSDFGKAFKEAVKEQMNVDLENVGFLEYNHFVAASIKDRFKAQIEAPTFNQIDEMLKDIIKAGDQKVELDHLVEMVRNQKSDYEHDHCGQFALIFARGGDSWNDGTIKIHFDEDKEDYRGRDKTAKDCRSSITISMETKKVIGFDMGYQGGTDAAKVTTYNHDFESKLFRMYAAGSVIDLGELQENIMEMTPGDEWTGYDLDIDCSYSWHEDY